ncbi:MAG TPA: ATP synthase F1 subunit gamma [Luteibaculaceae bacterium]|nr:ATP synthase F1 subunit gamma [Luteibaculaceae bacterium]
MPNLKEVRNRITSVNSTKQITSAMKMVSAAKLRRAQDAVVQMRPYAEKLQEILSNVSATLDISENAFSAQREVKNVLIIAITSNRGLCGAFNNNVIKNTTRLIQDDFKGKNVRVLGLGKKSFDHFKKSDQLALDGFPEKPFEIFDQLTFTNASALAQVAMDQFSQGKIDKVILVYNSFKNAASQVIKVEQFLPMIPQNQTSTSSVDYLFEPSKEEIVSGLIPKTLKLQLFKALLDSFASEHGARMTAMHKATDNASELLKALKLSYNKARQAAITNEILEIVGGAEALKA